MHSMEAILGYKWSYYLIVSVAENTISKIETGAFPYKCIIKM